MKRGKRGNSLDCDPGVQEGWHREEEANAHGGCAVCPHRIEDGNLSVAIGPR